MKCVYFSLPGIAFCVNVLYNWYVIVERTYNMNIYVYRETFRWMGIDVTFSDAVERLWVEGMGMDSIGRIICESLLDALERELEIRPEGSLKERFYAVKGALYRKNIRQVRDEVLDTEVSFRSHRITWNELFERISAIQNWADYIYGMPAWEVLIYAAEWLGLGEGDWIWKIPPRALLYMIIEKLNERPEEEEAE